MAQGQRDDNADEGLAHSESEEACKLQIQMLRVTELKFVLKHFRYPVSGKKSVLQSRAMVLLGLKGASKVGPVILQIPRMLPLNDIIRVNSLRKSESASILQSKKSAPEPLPPNSCWCNVTFKESDFYTDVETLVKPTPLVRNAGKKSSYMSFESVKVSLSDSQLSEIKLSRTMDDSDETKVFVHLRFCPNITGGPQADQFPTLCDVGARMQYDWYPISLNAATMKASPVDITLLFSAQSANVTTLLLRWLDRSSAANSKRFVYGINMVKQRSIEDVAKTIPVISAKDSKVKNKANLSSFTSSSEVSSSSQQISFLCPLSMSRIKDPCRGGNCKHLQCFDACTYLRLNRKKPRWICPVCQKDLPFTELEIDGLQLEILLHSTVSKIEFDMDGCWHPVLIDIKNVPLSVDDDCPLPTRKKRCNGKNDLIDLTIDDSPPQAISATTIVL